jgi:hypothetical protein
MLGPERNKKHSMERKVINQNSLQRLNVRRHTLRLMDHMREMRMNRLRVMVRKFCPFGRFYFMVSYLTSGGSDESKDDMDFQLARMESDVKAKMAKRKRTGGFCLFFVYFIFSISLWMYQLKMSIVLFFLLLLNRLGLYFHLDLKMIIVTILDVIIS